MKKTRTFSERFWEKVVVASPDECWIWNAAKRKSPIGGGKYLFYGHLKAGVTAGGPGKMILAHRASWELCNGPIPDGYLIDHTCHNTLCVNPKHLRIATPKQNAENRHRHSSASGFRGVTWNRDMKKWCAHYKEHGTRHHLGYFDCKHEAAEVARRARNEVFTHNDADRY
ncbi:HNH endonuclease signature motif containing protein [Enterobacter hormaechei]|uniref:HNH endonuclease signature motif containing protein n=1 Tax=Enterobacter hormaechei TaxID=158836 RepID=UPI0039C4AD40